MSDLAGLPRQVGKYRLDAVLGRGAMGVVYRAYDPLIERTLALKTVHRGLADPEQTHEMLQRFRKEAQAAGRLTHPNIVAVYEYGESADMAWIAMEFVDGQPLSELVTGTPLAPPRAAAWMGDLLAALAYAHARGVVHRDIKPANLLLTREGRLKVGDFGIARIESSTLTQTGAMLGTPSYMSPEQFRGETVDGRSDLFSAAVVLYQMLTGQRPFSGSAATVMQQVLTVTPPPPSHVHAALGAGLDAVVMRGLARAPEARFADAAEFARALDHAMQDAEAPAGASAGGDDATVLMAAPAAAAARRTVAPATEATAAMTAWKMAALPPLEALLTAQIGPLARLLLRRMAASAHDFDSLCARLLPHIPSPAARKDFAAELAALGRELVARQDPHGGQHAGAVAIGESTHAPDAAFGAAATALLAEEIGPIAAIVVKRALPQAAGRLALLELAAARIDDPAARARFLDRARALIGGPAAG
ncbi:serine/threonine-protein kinase [Pseudoduganella umbonata]|uniref:non-specific serine/threonine protein kinase n=1 Tax=Pseudoduganella umbonata TaxID=864828 RepID=A0A4P8HKV9_9BURK|nr:serine/threonine-protein kinase [Pseudoduganella umbonata]MBB3221224.1 serine/threonine-protein kinase [Pseudoduganella umbonata]QCP10409.1 serine/threonine protein kinase [Pseudoduganella umbonata]